MKHLCRKDRRRRIRYALYEQRHNSLLSVINNMSLSSFLRAQAYRTLIYLPRDSSVTRIRNRCTLTGRSRSIYMQFGLSRLRFRKLAREGKLNGIQKGS
jgi:ribosomal protein S14